MLPLSSSSKQDSYILGLYIFLPSHFPIYTLLLFIPTRTYSLLLSAKCLFRSPFISSVVSYCLYFLFIPSGSELKMRSVAEFNFQQQTKHNNIKSEVFLAAYSGTGLDTVQLHWWVPISLHILRLVSTALLTRPCRLKQHFPRNVDVYS